MEQIGLPLSLLTHVYNPRCPIMDSYRPRSDVVSTEIDEQESVLLSLKTQQYYSLNETGSRIWQLLTLGHDASAITDTVTEEWDIGPNEARRAVQSFLGTLHEEGLITEENTSGTDT